MIAAAAMPMMMPLFAYFADAAAIPRERAMRSARDAVA